MNKAKNQALKDMTASGVSIGVLIHEKDIIHFDENIEEIQIFLKIKTVKPIKK